MLIKRTFLLITLVLLGSGPASFAADIYVYARADGSRLITDHPRIEPGYSLLKIYGDEFTDTTGAMPSNRSGKLAASEFDGLIDLVSRRVLVDPALIKSVMQAESDFDPDALSKKGASGLMQLMPGTADRYGVTHIFNPQQNVLAGSRYLRDLLGQFDGDTRLALAGYNAGENAVVRYGGIPPYAETQRYVHKVMKLYERYRTQSCENTPAGVQVISCTDPNTDAYTSWKVQ